MQNLWAVFTVLLVVLFAFTNGFKDASAIVATVVSTRALSPQWALALVAAFEFLGASFLGTAVARTIGGKILYLPAAGTGPQGFILVSGAVLGALIWNLLSWKRALPTSSGQALLGGLLGASLCHAGIASVVWPTVGLVLLSLVGTPIVSFCIAALTTRFLSRLSEGLSPHWNDVYRWLQIPSCIAVSLAYSSNDAQGAMGVMTLGLILSHGSMLHDSMRGFFEVPRWVVETCAVAIALGVLAGGSRMLKTLGMKLYRIQPLQGFGAQVSSAASIFTAAIIGFPASTTQAITSSILGAGASLRPKAVRWQVVEEVVFAWLVTIPSSALLGALGYWVLRLAFRAVGG